MRVFVTDRRGTNLRIIMLVFVHCQEGLIHENAHSNTWESQSSVILR